MEKYKALIQKVFAIPFAQSGGNSTGMALPEVMISLFIVGSGLSFTAMKVGDIKDIQRDQRSDMGLNQAASALSAASVSLPTLIRSANEALNAENPLIGCVTTAGDCQEYTGADNAGYPFYLFNKYTKDRQQ